MLKKEVRPLKDVSLTVLDPLDSLKEVQQKLGTIQIPEYVKLDVDGNVNLIRSNYVQKN
jgi:hypothetical protein